MIVDVRRAKPSDSDTLLRLAEKLTPIEEKKSQRPNTLKSSFDDSKHEIFVAENQGTVVGFADLWVFPDFVEGGQIALIGNLIVDEAFRGQGVGSLLLKKVIERAEEKEALEIHIWTEFNNKQAINLYKKHGLTTEHLLLEKEF